MRKLQQVCRRLLSSSQYQDAFTSLAPDSILFYSIILYYIIYYIISPLSSDYSINNHNYPSIFNNCVIQIDPVHLHDNLQSCLQMLSSNNRNADACVKSLHGLKIGTRSVHVGSRKKMISDLS